MLHRPIESAALSGRLKPMIVLTVFFTPKDLEEYKKRYGFTKKDLYGGSPLSAFLWVVSTISLFIIMGIGFAKYPIVGGDNQLHLLILIAVFIVSFSLLVIFRKKVFSYHNKVPRLLLLVFIFSVSLFLMLFFEGLFLVINGNMDTPFIPLKHL